MKRRQFVTESLFRTGLGIAAAASCGIAHADTAQNRQRKRTVRFAHLTDVHLYASRNSAQGLTQALHHIQSHSDAPEFLVNGGDAIYDALEVDRSRLEQQWALWKSVWAGENSLPVRHCLGNHDVWGWNKSGSKTTGQEDGWGKRYSLDQLGLDNSWYSFERGGWKFIVLDSITPDEQTVYRGELSEEQFRWLEQQLKAAPANQPVVILSHIPILTVGDVGWSRELAAQPMGHKMLSHVDKGELLQLFRKHPNVKLCLSGHTHLTERIEIAGITFVNSGAISGLWWKGNNAHTDEGYNMVDLYDDGTFETQYHGYSWNVSKA